MVKMVKKRAEKQKKESPMWISDPKAESVMQELGLSWTIKTVNFSDIDLEESRKNVGRVGRLIDEEITTSMACQMIDGHKGWPMPILYGDLDRLLVAAGLHRTISGDEAELKDLPVYYVESLRFETFRLLTTMTNDREGTRLSKEQKLIQAVHLINQYEMSVSEVARYLSLNESAVKAKISIERVRGLCEQAGFRGKLKDVAYKHLGKLKGDQKVMVAVAQHIGRRKLKGEEIQLLVKSVMSQPSERERIEVLRADSKSKSLASKTREGPGRPSRPILRKLLGAISSLAAIGNAHTTAEEVQLKEGTSEYLQTKKEWQKARASINKIFS